MEKLKELIILLLKGETLPERYENHPLSGRWKGCFDAHITPDWILIYELSDDSITFLRTGTHSDLF
jgi:mRNA interferase YafQ